MSRGAKRARSRLTVTALFAGGEGELVCRTRDISSTGLFLETPVAVDPGTRVELSLLDHATGDALSLVGMVARLVPAAPGGTAGMGIKLSVIPPEWTKLVARAVGNERPTSVSGEMKAIRRLRILVVGDDARRRGALALYVTSGWDVRFASDLDGAEEALRGFRIDAVIAEHELDDPRWTRLLEAARRFQPAARRIVRASLRGQAAPERGGTADLVHRVVDQDAGLDAVLDALAE